MSIRRICSVLGLARSSYYVKRKPEQHRLAQHSLELQIRALHKEHREALGARGLSKELRKSGIFIGRHRMGTLIKTLGLPRRRPRYAHYRRATKPAVTAPNILDRRFNPIQPNTLWAGYITYIKVKDSWLYLAVVMDLFSRRIVGRACSRAADTELSIKALGLAVARRRPMPELLFHSDQGCLYCSDLYQKLHVRHGIACSMTDGYDCYQNALAERVNGILKTEFLLHRHRGLAEAIGMVDESINIYNSKRPHLLLKCKTPDAVHRALLG